MNCGRKRKRFGWTPELHRRFVCAIFDYGIRHCCPSQLFDLLQPAPTELTREKIKSHLQKYRKNVAESRKKFLDEFDRSERRAKEEEETAKKRGEKSLPTKFRTFPVFLPAPPGEPTEFSEDEFGEHDSGQVFENVGSQEEFDWNAGELSMLMSPTRKRPRLNTIEGVPRQDLLLKEEVVEPPQRYASSEEFLDSLVTECQDNLRRSHTLETVPSSFENVWQPHPSLEFLTGAEHLQLVEPELPPPEPIAGDEGLWYGIEEADIS